MEVRLVVRRLVSGGQTGVDRAALDVALDLGLPCGGWCPRGRRAEDGRIPDRYPLVETPTRFYPERTERNVRGSDGTLILAPGRPRGGTALTARLAGSIGRPYLVIDLSQPADPEAVRRWIEARRIAKLNVAGPRESEAPGVYQKASGLLRAILVPSDAGSGPPAP
jgi:hypothetical protein